MKVIGFRCSPKCVRYALVEVDGVAGTLLNADSESKLVFPAGMDGIEDKMVWLSDEIDRIFHQVGDIDRAVIKTNEYTTDTKAKRGTTYMDAVIMLGCAKRNLPVAAKIYASLGTTSGKVLGHAEHRAGKTTKYWDKQMADAVVAAWSGRK